LGSVSLRSHSEKLKEKLEEEGLFDEFHKKSIPEYPTRIGIITSPTGAAIQDMKNVLSRRFPVTILLYPARVQGDEAAGEIAEGIREFNKRKNVDVIIVGRGGGSIEDLWPFNEEIVARAIFASKIPIISAVGHETDFTIADFVADLRAPTPLGCRRTRCSGKNCAHEYSRILCGSDAEYSQQQSSRAFSSM